MEAVITADIVNSTKLGQREFELLVRDINNIFHDRIEFYRGDSFQAIVYNAENAYENILLSRLKAITYSKTERIDIRLSLSLGYVDKNIINLGSHLDDIFIASGRTFDKLDKYDNLLLIKSKDEKINYSYDLIARYTDSLLSQVSPKQAMVLFHLLLGYNQKEVAKMLDKKAPTISQQVKASRFDELKILMKNYKFITKIISNGR